MRVTTRLALVVIIGSAAFVPATSASQSAPRLSEQEARAKAIALLKGDPYGNSDAEVARNIKQVEWLRDGNTKACGQTRQPAWEFHVVVVTDNKDQFNNGIIDGYLALDARTGKIRCTNLPLLN